MPYLLQSEIAANLPPQFLTEALDDDGDGEADAGVWDAVEASAAEAIDGILGQRYTVPFASPIPAVVKSAARVFALETLYARRGIPAEQNPWTRQAAELRTKLTAIAKGEEPLSPTVNKPKPSVAAETEPAKTTSAHGHLPC